MSGSAPPTLIDRLTRMDGARGTGLSGQGSAAAPGAASDQPSGLDDLLDKSLAASGRSHGKVKRGTEPHLSTDFAITTVNVPDRLDLREVRDQAEEDYKRPGFFSIDRYLLGLWVRRIFWITVLGLLGFWAYNTVQPIRQDLSADRIAQRLGAAGLPVRVAGTAYRFTPNPKFVLLGVQIADDIRFDEVAIRFNWQDTWSALRSGAWTWGDATVAPVRLSSGQAWSLLNSISVMSKALPASLSILRFESIEMVDAPMLKGRFEAVVRRGTNGQFGSVAIAEAGERSTFKLTLTQPATGAAGSRFGFQFDASDWTLPLGPNLKWGDVTATGFASPSLFEVESYSIAGAHGVVQGALYAATDQHWVLTGYARGTGLSVESIVAAAAKVNAPAADPSSAARVVPFTGTATLDLALGGRGDSLAGAIGQGVMAGPVHLRWASINGINLGYVATHGGSDRGLGGGQTRFSELEASVVGGPDGLLVRNILARAGAMSTRGEIRVGSDLALAGALRVDMGATRVQAPINLRVRGTLMSPQFGR